ncbi:DUF4126 domain-containing protein [bacterium AH-315-E10]|nr:DUF4126 domain-containing protein [bacterium AH-315-E10]
MGVFTILSSLGSVVPLASRAFLSLFIVCLLGAFPDVPAFFGIDYAIIFPESLQFMAHPVFLIIVGVLAVIECAADKDEDAKEVLDNIMLVIKPAVAILVALAIIPYDSPQIVPHVNEVQEAAIISKQGLLALLIGGLTFVVAFWRNRFFDWLRDVDSEDSFGIRYIFSYVEDLFGGLAMVFAIILPAIALVFAGILIGMCILVNRLVDRYERKQYHDCPECSESIAPTSMKCHHCHQEVKPIYTLNWGFSRQKIPCEGDLSDDIIRNHRLRLISMRRCPDCAEKVKLKDFLVDGCDACGASISSDSDWFEDYNAAVIQRSGQLFLPLIVMSIIPVIGFSVALVAIRLYLVAPLSIFIKGFRRFKLRWMLRLVILLLVIPSCIPGFSLLSIPIMVLIHIKLYGRSAKKFVAEKRIAVNEKEADVLKNTGATAIP